MDREEEEEEIFLEIQSNQKLVEITVEFIRLGEIDTMNEKYTAEICIEAEWSLSSGGDDDEDDELFNQAHQLVYDEHTEWNPKLFIENCLHKIEERITYRSRIENKKKFITETRYIKGYSNLL